MRTSSTRPSTQAPDGPGSLPAYAPSERLGGSDAGTEVIGQPVVQCAPKTAAGKRTMSMPSFVARSLAAHIDLYALPGAEGLVLPSADGQPMRRSNFRRWVWEPAAAEVGSAPARQTAQAAGTFCTATTRRDRVKKGGGCEAAGHGRRVDEVADAGGVECLPAAAIVEHLGEVHDEYVVVRRRVARL